MNLTTLNNYSLQVIFDKVSNHLLTQKVKSGDINHNSLFSSKYKSDTGLKCAVGCLISDEEYDINLEGWAIENPKFNKFNISEDRGELLYQLQIIHDTNTPENWKKELEKLATKNNLTFNDIE